jgi:hypothetical protein
VETPVDPVGLQYRVERSTRLDRRSGGPVSINLFDERQWQLLRLGHDE